MRKAIWVILASVIGTGPTLSAEQATKLDGQSVEISWQMSTNAWPEKLWVYKVSPQIFSELVISNLLAVGGFTKKDRTRTPEYLAKVDKKAVFFGILEGTCKHLAICPTLGYVEYHDGMAEAVTNAVVGVPDQNQATQLGFTYLRMLGIDRSQLATKTGTNDLDLHWQRRWLTFSDQKTGKPTQETNNFGVFFNRQIDGLNVAGIGLHGGLFVSFGNNAKVADLKVSWRNLERLLLCECPSPKQIENWVREGKTVGHLGKPMASSKITIFKGTFLYDGNLGDEPMDFVYPYAVFNATVENDHHKNNIQFECPMTLIQDNWKILK